jgi:hypothetical protein
MTIEAQLSCGLLRDVPFDAVARTASNARHRTVNMTGDLDIVVGKLPELAIVEANLLFFGTGTQRQAGDQVHEEQYDTGHDEGVREPGDTVGQLIAELDVVLVDPAAGDLGKAVKASDIITVLVSLGTFDGSDNFNLRSKETCK